VWASFVCLAVQESTLYFPVVAILGQTLIKVVSSNSMQNV